MKKYMKIPIIFIALILFTVSVFADGSGNIDSGGSGGTGSGSSKNKWSYGDDGVRITIINDETNQPIRQPIDFTNKSRNDIKYHFGKISKIDYRGGKNLTLYQGSYNYIVPSNKMPTIVSNKGNDIATIKKYFTSEWTAKRISEKCNIDYEELISGKYKLLLEPMIYVTYKGNRLAMTSHEAALYNQKMKNDIVMKFNSISHRSLPFSMFLETPDLGFPAYQGQTNKAVNDVVIKQKLGLGIVRFKGAIPDDPEKPPEEPPEEIPEIPEKPPEEKPDIDIDVANYQYRTDTDVITALEIKSTNRVTPNNSISVTFNILGKKYTVNNVVMPSNSSQLVWVKWHTPKTPQTVNISVDITNATIRGATIKAVIGDLNEITPPDPKARDINNNFRLSNLPDNGNRTSASWSKWFCRWKSDWRWVSYGKDENGHTKRKLVDFGDWEYTITRYSADFSANIDLVPGLRTPPTWTEKRGEYEMKSGYGTNVKVNTSVTCNGSSNDITSAQNVVTTFSEFNYKKYNRILQKTINNGLKSQFEFKKNKYSTYNDRTHFTPIWYPDGVNYIVNAEVFDIWTPVGMLKANINDKIKIDSNLHTDRHIGIMK